MHKPLIHREKMDEWLIGSALQGERNLQFIEDLLLNGG